MVFRLIARKAVQTFPALGRVSDGTWVALTLTAFTISYFGSPMNKNGHDAFDVSKPQAVQMAMDNEEKIRLKNFNPRPPTENQQ